jgi:hypothetical protein
MSKTTGAGIPANALAPSITPQQLGNVIDLLAKAPCTVAQGVQLSAVIQVLVMLANQKHPIGALVPALVPEAAPGA